MNLRAEGLRKKYHNRWVVNDVDIQVSSGEIIGLLGPNGAGKTTTFHIIVGLIDSDEGKIFMDSRELTSLPMYKRARWGIGYLPQESSVFRGLSVEDNLMAILETLPITDEERESRLELILKDMGIARLRKQKAYTLSGGERRRVEISRAMVTSPSFLLLDEPFVGIDPLTVVDIQNIIQKLKSQGLGIFITDHNVWEMLQTIDRAYIMYEGKLLLSGTARELLESEEARKVYLGEKFRQNLSESLQK